MKKILLIIAISFSSFGAFAQNGMFGITYNFGLATGEMNTFIGKFSARGFGIEGQGFLNDNISLGGSFSWNVFFEEKVNESYVDGSQTITANQFRYINAFPIMFTAHYYFGADDGSTTRFFAGLGVGPSKINQRVELGIFQITHDYWHFAIAPEVGVLIPISFTSNVLVSVRYNYAFKSHDQSFGYFGFNVGFAWM